MGEAVLAASPDGLLGTDLRSGASVATFDDCAPQARAFGVLGSSSGYVFGADAQKALWYVWGWGDRKPKYRGTLPEKMSSMTFTADAALCFAGSRSGSIYVWLASTGRLLRCWPAHCREVTQLAISQDQSFLVSGSGDATVHLYSIADIFVERTPKPLHSWAGHSLPVTSLAFVPGTGLQQAVASASLDQSVRLWDVGTGRPLQARSFASPVTCISVGAGGSVVLCACKNSELRSFSLSSAPGKDEGLFAGHTGPVSSCALNADSSYAASSSETDCVRIWELRTRQCITQAHTSRNMQVSSVQIVRRPTHPQPLPLLQPLQKLLTATDDIPDVPLACGGCSDSLRSELESRAEPWDFLDRAVWARAASTGKDIVGIVEMTERCAAAEASQARWANVASGMYAQLVELGQDVQMPRLPLPPPQPKPQVDQAQLAPTARKEDVSRQPEKPERVSIATHSAAAVAAAVAAAALRKSSAPSGAITKAPPTMVPPTMVPPAEQPKEKKQRKASDLEEPPQPPKQQQSSAPSIRTPVPEPVEAATPSAAAVAAAAVAAALRKPSAPSGRGQQQKQQQQGSSKPSGGGASAAAAEVTAAKKKKKRKMLPEIQAVPGSPHLKAVV